MYNVKENPEWLYKFYWKCGDEVVEIRTNGDASFEDLKEIFRRFLLCSGWQPITVDKMYLTDEEGDSVEN